MTSSSSHAGRARFQIDELCSRFEDQWDGEYPIASGMIELLGEVPESQRPALLEELISVELELRVSVGQVPTEHEYSTLFPAFVSSVENAFRWMQSDQFRRRTPETPLPLRIGDFGIVCEVGRGGMGIVYEAVQESLGRRVAIKTFAPRIATPELKIRFDREIKTIGSLRHTNIVEVYGTGEDDGISYFAMQLIEGQSLKERIESLRSESGLNHSLSNIHQQWVAKIGKQVASGLAYAHENGVLHRDIKPSNILLDEEGTAHIGDFGLAKFTLDDDDLTQTGEVIGSLRYLAPEVVTRNHSDVQSDVFSLGLTLYELLTLEPAYQGKGASQLLHQTSKAQIVRPRKCNASIDRDLESIIMKCLARDASDRYQAVDDVRRDLEMYLDGHPVSAARTSTIRRVWKWANRNPALTALFSLLFFVATVGFPTLAILNSSAITAKILAESKRTEAELARFDARKREYGSLIQLAGKFVEDGHGNEAEPLLNQCRPKLGETDFRDWEWYFVESQFDSSKFQLHGHSGWVHHVAIRPDGKQIVSVGGPTLIPNQAPGESILWNAETGAQELLIPGDATGAVGAAYRPDGKELALLSFQNPYRDGLGLAKDNAPGSIQIWDPNSHELLRSFVRHGAYPTSLYPILPGVQYSPSGKQILVWPRPIQLLDASSGETLWQVDHGLQAAFVDESTIAILAEDTISYIDANSGSLIKKVPTEKMNFLTSLGQQRLSAISRDRLRCWKWTDLAHEDESISAVTPSISWGTLAPNQSRLVYGDGEGALRIKSLHSDAPFEIRLGHQGQITSGAVSSDQSFFVSGSRDRTVRVWEAEWNSIRKFDTKLRTRIGDFAFANSGEVVFAGNSKAANSKRDFPQAGIFKGKQGKLVTSIPSTTFAIHAARNDICFSPDGQLLAAPMQEPKVSDSFLGFASSQKIGIWTSGSAELLATVNADMDQITCLRWNNDSNSLAVSGTIGNKPHLCVFSSENADSNSEEYVFQCSNAFDLMQWLGNERPSVVSFSNDGRQVAVASGKQVLVLDLGSFEFKPLYRSSNDRCRITFLDFSPDSLRLAVAFHNERVVREFDLQTNEINYETTAPRSVSCVRYSPNGKRIAMNGYDSRIYLCDASNGYRLLTLNGCDQVNGGHQFTPRVKFSRDGKKIAANNFIGEIVVWSVDHKIGE